MHDVFDELRLLRERMAELERRLESRVQDDGAVPWAARWGAPCQFLLGGIGGGQTAYVDWLGGVLGRPSAGVDVRTYRGPASTCRAGARPAHWRSPHGIRRVERPGWHLGHREGSADVGAFRFAPGCACCAVDCTVPLGPFCDCSGPLAGGVVRVWNDAGFDRSFPIDNGYAAVGVPGPGTYHAVLTGPYPARLRCPT